MTKNTLDIDLETLKLPEISKTFPQIDFLPLLGTDYIPEVYICIGRSVYIYTCIYEI